MVNTRPKVTNVWVQAIKYEQTLENHVKCNPTWSGSKRVGHDSVACRWFCYRNVFIAADVTAS